MRYLVLTDFHRDSKILVNMAHITGVHEESTQPPGVVLPCTVIDVVQDLVYVVKETVEEVQKQIDSRNAVNRMLEG